MPKLKLPPSAATNREHPPASGENAGSVVPAPFAPLRVLDLFSGIGGFSLGLERTGGFQTVAFCEIEPFPRRVLAKHWPGVPVYEDVRTLTAERLEADGISIDAICGGFPCQDISDAGAKAGIKGERSGLWSEYARLIGELRPCFVIVENVAALLGRGLDKVLGDLAALGFDAEWHCIPASALGAPHIRDRIWIVANSASAQCTRLPRRAEEKLAVIGSPGEYVAHTERLGRFPMVQSIIGRAIVEGAASPIADAGLSRGWRWWSAEPDVGRVADGVPSRVDRLRALGNAVVPQIPELIGRAILAAEATP